jgi:hypothetical protein
VAFAANSTVNGCYDLVISQLAAAYRAHLIAVAPRP